MLTYTKRERGERDELDRHASHKKWTDKQQRQRQRQQQRQTVLPRGPNMVPFLKPKQPSWILKTFQKKQKSLLFQHVDIKLPSQRWETGDI